MDKQTEKEIIDFQNLQQQLQIIVMQRQQLAMQSAEMQKSLEEVKSSDGALYRFVGTVIVPKKKAALEAELKAEKETLDNRQSLMQKQEEKLRERYDMLRKKIEAELKKEKQAN